LRIGAETPTHKIVGFAPDLRGFETVSSAATRVGPSRFRSILHRKNHIYLLDILLYLYNNMFYYLTRYLRGGAKLHNRIAVLRAERGLSRSDLANALDINFQTVGYLERGDFNPSLELAFKISEYFQLPIEAIFSRKPLRPLSEELYGKKDPNKKSAPK
jgi:putative transcriptional regulator